MSEPQAIEESKPFAYRWEWGETGTCTAEEAALLQQKSASLGRTVAIYPVQAPAPAPLTRDERVQLTAKSLVLEAELEEAKSAGLATYRRNQDLQVQLNTAIVKERELKAQLADAKVTVETVSKDNDQLNQKNGELLVELERLRSLETLVAERDAAERNERGLEGETPHVVDG